MKRLAVIPSETIEAYLRVGYNADWLRKYYNPDHYFDEVYLLSPLEESQPDLLGMKVVKTKPNQLKKRLKELKIDVVRAYGGYWACDMACNHKVPGVPVIVSVHDSKRENLFKSVKKADYVWCVAKEVEKTVLEKYQHPHQVWILPNRVDFDFMKTPVGDKFADLNKLYPFKHKIVHVGRRDPQKNLDNQIKALKILGPDYCLVAIGIGPKDEYLSLAKKYKVSDQLFLVDSVKHEELARYYAWADCMCTPSRYEGFGMVFIEALASGALVVTSDIGPMNEYITDGENGLLIKNFEDPKAIASVIKIACTDKALGRQIRAAARSSVEQFERSKIDTLEAKFYDKVISQNHQEKKMPELRHQPDINDHYNQALNWVKQNTIPEQGIIITSKDRVPYLEVTGYLIPTLLDAGDDNLARQYAEFLSYVQRPSGAFAGSDGLEYLFDSAQALRGLLRASTVWEQYKPIAKKAADYVANSIINYQNTPESYGTAITEYVFMYTIAPLLEAGRLLKDKKYITAAKKALKYYLDQPDILDQNRLTHFLSYIIDGFIEAGETKFIRQTVDDIFSRQQKNGAITAFPNVKWVCSTGLAQLAIIAYKMGKIEEADLAIGYLCSIQNKSGGFYGSYGRGANYFPKAEISWANKFFLDALHLRQKYHPASKVVQTKLKPLDAKLWHKAMLGETDIEQIAGRVRSNKFPVWIKPLLVNSKPGEAMVELGSGTGEMSAILATYGRTVHLIDFSAETIKFNKSLFKHLGLEGSFYKADILQKLPFANNSIDWVWSSGTLEHFTETQIVAILKEAHRIARKGVITLVPNAGALFYRIGKFDLEASGQWAYGEENAKFSLCAVHQQAGFKNITESTIGIMHNLDFLPESKTKATQFIDSLSLEEANALNQGYLLVTIGEK